MGLVMCNKGRYFGLYFQIVHSILKIIFDISIKIQNWDNSYKKNAKFYKRVDWIDSVWNAQN